MFKHLSSRLWIAAGVALLLGACSSKRDIPLNPSQQENNFTQAPSTLNNSIDILFVVDDSGSMAPYQTNLANNFQAFIENFQAKDFNFQIGVTTTDTRDYTNPIHNVQGRLLEVPGKSTKILQKDSPTLETDFINLIQVGTIGSGDEKPFDAIEDAFTDRIVDGSNEGFLRDDSFLAIIIVSDEDDGSRPFGVPSDDSENGDRPGHYPISDYTDVLDNVTNTSGSLRRYNVSGIAAFEEDCWGSDVLFTRRGNRIEELVEATNGVTGDICDTSFATALNAIQSKVATLSTAFALDREPRVDTISVAVDGNSISQDDSNGWSYDAESNSILFHGDAVPSQGSEIQVSFTPVEANA